MTASPWLRGPGVSARDFHGRDRRAALSVLAASLTQGGLDARRDPGRDASISRRRRSRTEASWPRRHQPLGGHHVHSDVSPNDEHHRDTALPRRHSGRKAHRASPAHCGHPVAREGDRRRPVAGRAASGDAGTRAPLGHRVRLARVRGQAERPAAVHDRDRRARHSFHPRPLAARGRVAAHRQPRVAWLGHRAAEDHRSADRSHGPWRQRSGRLPRGDPVDAGLRGSPASRPAPAGVPSGWAGPGQT